jgi:hypothetical protein
LTTASSRISGIGKGRIALLAGDDDPVNAGNTIRFGSRPGKGFFPSAAAGNGIVAIFTMGL